MREQNILLVKAGEEGIKLTDARRQNLSQLFRVRTGQAQSSIAPDQTAPQTQMPENLDQTPPSTAANAEADLPEAGNGGSEDREREKDLQTIKQIAIASLPSGASQESKVTGAESKFGEEANAKTSKEPISESDVKGKSLLGPESEHQEPRA